MRSLGKGISEFKKGVQGIQEEMNDIDQKKIEHKGEPAEKSSR
jgi:Sec-independent protein translocase protein TatA